MAREERRVAAERIEDERLVRVRCVDHEGGPVVEIHVHRADANALHRYLRAEPERDAFVGLDAEYESVRFETGQSLAREELVGRDTELDRDLGRVFWEPLAGADVERDPFPAPVVDPHLQRDVRLGALAGRHAPLLSLTQYGHDLDAATRVLASHRVHREAFARHPAQRAQDLHLLVADGLVVERGRRLHRDKREELEQVVLDDVAHRAGLLVVARALLDADRLGDRDLDVVDVLAVPDRLEDPVRETHDEDVLDGLLAEVVIDAEHLVLAEDRVHDLVELERRRAVVAERLLDHDARPSGLTTKAVLADRLDDRLVRGGRSREIEEPVGMSAEREVKLVECPPQLLVPGIVRGRDKMQMLREASPHLLVQRLRPAVLRDGGVQLLAVFLVRQRFSRGADDRERRREKALEREVVERGDELALREIARPAEDDDRGGLGDPREPKPLAQRVEGRGRQLTYSFLTA